MGQRPWAWPTHARHVCLTVWTKQCAKTCQDLPAKSLTLFHIVLNILNGMTRRVSCFGFQEPTWIHFKAGSAWPAKNRQRYQMYHKDHTKRITPQAETRPICRVLWLCFSLGSLLFHVVCELLSAEMCWALERTWRRCCSHWPTASTAFGTGCPTAPSLPNPPKSTRSTKLRRLRRPNVLRTVHDTSMS